MKDERAKFISCCCLWYCHVYITVSKISRLQPRIIPMKTAVYSIVYYQQGQSSRFQTISVISNINHPGVNHPGIHCPCQGQSFLCLCLCLQQILQPLLLEIPSVIIMLTRFHNQEELRARPLGDTLLHQDSDDTPSYMLDLCTTNDLSSPTSKARGSCLERSTGSDLPLD